MADTPAAPGLLAAVKAVLPKLLSRKLLVTIVTKGSILAVAWLSTKIDAHLATTMIEVVVPSLVVTGVGYGVAQGMVDRAEAQGDLGAEVKAAIEAGLAAKPAP